MAANNSFVICQNNRTLISHDSNSPFCYVGIGDETFEMYRGNFKISDCLNQRIPLSHAKVTQTSHGQNIVLSYSKDTCPVLQLDVEQSPSSAIITYTILDSKYNRFWFRLNSSKDEHFYGCGEQMSYFDLKGREFPLWTSEPGVGRDKSSYITFMSDKDCAGGDYYTTNYPQPSFISSNKYLAHLETTAYTKFDFSHDDFIELESWHLPQQLIIKFADSFPQLAKEVSALFGTQPKLPDWVHNGVIVGIQGGDEVVKEKLIPLQNHKASIAGVWLQDWEGIRMTSFGKRLMWDWKWDEKLYPQLPQTIKRWQDENIAFLGYINTSLAVDGTLYKEAENQGYFVKNDKGETYITDFGEFYCGTIDLTNPSARKWYKYRVLKQNMIDLGQKGWMSDFGEYLPTDAVLFSGIDAKLAHNMWPVLWAQLNREAIEEAGKTGEILFFSRSGGTGSQKNTVSMWTGDQSVDFSRHDGLGSAIRAMLSSATIGIGVNHSDIGGYTSLHGNLRTAEVLHRWIEFGAFTPVMRTHEGNRPYDCHQYYDDDFSSELLAKFSNIHKALTPYLKHVLNEYYTKSLPTIRPLFYHYNNEICFNIDQQYLLGDDLLVAPITQAGINKWKVYIPSDDWVHLWSGTHTTTGWVEVYAPIGRIPVFYKKDSEFSDLFSSINKLGFV